MRKALRRLVDTHAHHFEKGGRFERFEPIWEAGQTFLFTPGEVTHDAPHVRDGLDLKRLMMTVVIALGGCIVMAMYNTGLQANLAIEAGAAPLQGWQTTSLSAMGIGLDPASISDCLLHGALYFVPVMVVSYLVGGLWEALFAIVRRHPMNEGFLVTGMLFPLTLPATIPLWQVAIGISFGVVIGKEVFGGTGMNILNPALVARAFLFFAYPAEISGNEVWIAADLQTPDAVSGATPLATAAIDGMAGIAAGMSWWDAFLGLVPGSMGETSALACLLGALLLVVTGVGSWRIMAGVTLGTTVTALLLNFIGSDSNPLFAIPLWWHLVVGGWMFGMVFMATDPVTASQTQTGRWIYGLLIGVLAVLIRVLNPAFPEGMMLAVLLMNVFAATIDHFVVESNVRRRRRRHGNR